MCRKVIKRKNIVVTHEFDDGAGNTLPIIEKNINLSFQPDTMVVKLISAIGSQEPTLRSDAVFMLYCRNINEFIGSFFDCSTNSLAHFFLNYE